MKKQILKTRITLVMLISFLLAAGISAYSQDPAARPMLSKESREKVKAHRVAFLTDQLSLTSEEAQKFWPVYNEYEAKMEEHLRDYREELPGTPPPDIEILSDQEITKLLNEEIDREMQRVKIKKEYYDKFRKVLSDRKVLRLLQAEKEFRKVLIEKVRGREMAPREKPRRNR